MSESIAKRVSLLAPGGVASEFRWAEYLLENLDRFGLAVVDNHAPNVEAVTELFWLQLQDYMPGMDREDWDRLTARMEPGIRAALRGDNP